MFTFCDVLYEQNKKRKQTLESAQYGLESSLINRYLFLRIQNFAQVNITKLI